MGSMRGWQMRGLLIKSRLIRFGLIYIPVTNQQYLEFTQNTGYITYSGEDPDPKDFPGVPKDKLVAGSAGFQSPKHKVDMGNNLNML